MSENQQLLAGFAKIDMTPDYPVGLAGYSDAEKRIHEMVVEPVYATCIALSEGEETILVFTIDNCACEHGTAENIRAAVTAATDIPGEKIFCSATHGHNCPAVWGYNGRRFAQQMYATCAVAAKEALADLAPAKILAAKKEFPGMNFVRHFMTANGTPAGSNFGTFKDNPAVGYLSEPDKQMVLIKFEREGFKKPILLINWQGHPDRGSQIGRLNMAPSYPAPLRDTAEALTGCLVAYFTGADGNTNIDTRVEADKHGLNWREYGVKMATLAYEAYKELQEVEGSGISYQRVMFEADIDHSWDDKIQQAREVYDLWKATDAKTAMEIGRTYGFTSVYQSRAIKSRYEMPKTRTLELNAFRVGGIGFTTGTYEMFSEAGIYIKANSPYEYTFLLTGNSGYIPSDNAFNYRCYEADTGFFARGTAEKLAEKYVEMLKDIQ